jgi:Tol biopolymer transport system component/predicted Ser/Thr protein kinase
MTAMDPKRWQQIEQLYHAALEQEPSQRDGFLIEVCIGDDDLRREVESLLAQSGSTGALVDRSAWEVEAVTADTRSILTPGARLGPYEIVGPLGEGGMGIVYRARDTRLDRAVAIKISAEQFSTRFEREARAISALNHPHICTLYDVGPNYLVMELVDGQTLASHLRKGPLAMERVLRYGAQIASALAAAHRCGIVHRDLKPANIMITEAGIKVLDFGVARLAPGPGVAAEPTLTGRGALLGTPAYMAPEQLEEKECDPRTDVFALGLVLYEMATGKRAFAAKSKAALIAEILRCQPPPLENGPPQFARVARRCLAKEPERRWHSASDVKLELEEMAAELSAVSPQRRRRVRVSRISGFRLASFALLLAAVAGIIWLTMRPKPTPRPPTFMQLTDQPGPELYPSLSPDGKSFVYQGRAAGKWDIYLQRVGGRNPFNLTKDSGDDNTQPTFSPDGEHIAFRSEREGGGIFVSGASGENVKRLADFGYNPAWSPDGKEIVCATAGFSIPEGRPGNLHSQLFRINLATGEKRQVKPNRVDAVQPAWSPHGYRLAFWGLREGKRDIWTVASDGGEPATVTDDSDIDWNPIWSPDGKHLYFSSNRGGTMNLWRVRIDETSGKLLGPLESVITPSPYSGLMAFSHDGKRLVYVSQTWNRNLYRVAFDPSRETTVGQPLPITHGSTMRYSADLSPDGRWLTSGGSNGKWEDIFVVATDGNGLRQLTDDIYIDRDPRWSPDGRRIAFYSDRSGAFQIWVIHPDGSGLKQLTNEARSFVNDPVWSPDGLRLAFSIMDVNSFIMEVAKSWSVQSPQPLPRPSGLDSYLQVTDWSRHGDMLAGALRQGAGPAGIAVYSLGQQELQPLTRKGSQPRWLSDGRRLLFGYSGKLYLVDSRTRKVHEVLSVAPYEVSADAKPSPDDRWIYFTLIANEADIWEMSLVQPSH